MLFWPARSDTRFTSNRPGRNFPMISVLGNFRTPDFSQSLALFPDSTVVSASFGVYVADDVQKI